MPFQPGNKLGEKSRELEKIMRRACEQEEYKRVRMACEKMLDLAAQGSLDALEFVRDTIDGKPTQAVDVNKTVSYGHFLIPVSERDVDPVGTTVRPAGTGDTQGVH